MDVITINSTTLSVAREKRCTKKISILKYFLINFSCARCAGIFAISRDIDRAREMFKRLFSSDVIFINEVHSLLQVKHVAGNARDQPARSAPRDLKYVIKRFQ